MFNGAILIGANERNGGEPFHAINPATGEKGDVAFSSAMQSGYTSARRLQNAGEWSLRTVWQSSWTMTCLTSVGSRNSRFLFRLIVLRSEQLPHLVFCPLTMALAYGRSSSSLRLSSQGM